MSIKHGYNFKSARTPEQIAYMERLAREGKCFMCYEHLKEYENNRIELETRHWIITKNAYPYKHTTLHVLLVARRHVITFSELTKEERADFSEAIARCEKRWKLGSYGVGMRSGDFRYNGGSVEHLHAHIIVGERDPKKFEKVRFKVSSLPDQE